MPPADSGGLVQGNTYSGTFAGAVLFAGTTTFNEAYTSFSGATMYAINVGNLATVNEATLAKYAKTDKPTGFPGSTGYFAKIKDAIDYSDSGAAISVTAGTFTEGPQLVISKNITLTGAGMAATIITPSQDTGSSGDPRGWFLVNPTYTLNLSNLNLDGAGKSLPGLPNQRQGLGQQCRLPQYPVQRQRPRLSRHGCGCFWRWTVTINSCTFTHIGRVGVLSLARASTDRLYSNNTFTGKGTGDWLDYAVEVGGGAQATISNNTISGNNWA